MRISEFSDERKARDRLNEAVGAFGAALEIRSLEATPEDWGISQWNLANALILRSRLEEGEIAASDLRSAAEACREALKAFPRDGKPGDHARVQLTLAQSLGELAEVAPDETEAARAADQAVWILVRTLGQLEVSETGDLRASLRRELDHIQRVRGILRAG